MKPADSPPYYAVIFTSVLSENTEGYGEMADRMEELAGREPGYLGIKSVREGTLGITISYWKNESSIESWKSNLEHLAAQKLGKHQWYKEYSVQIAKVERAYGPDQ